MYFSLVSHKLFLQSHFTYCSYCVYPDQPVDENPRESGKEKQTLVQVRSSLVFIDFDCVPSVSSFLVLPLVRVNPR